MRVISKDEEKILWDKLNNEFKFKPGTDIIGEWIIIPGDTKKYHKAIPWNEEQENIINSILKELGLEKMYALDWNHDCFEFSPIDYCLNDGFESIDNFYNKVSQKYANVFADKYGVRDSRRCGFTFKWDDYDEFKKILDKEYKDYLSV